jgi:site-specific DNA recombinase
MPNVVTYCRVSSDEQALKDLSIPAQRKALRGWIDERPEHRLLAEFVDEGQSAYSRGEKRPGLGEMVAFCRSHAVDLIIVHKLDRFSRNREESIVYKALLRKLGVTVKSVTEHYDADTPQGFLYEGMIEVINQFYSMNLATETMKGMRENAERGFYNGGKTPYGYRVEKVGMEPGRQHSRLVFGAADEVATVREIFRLTVGDGLGVKAIARCLNEQQVPAPCGQRWSPSTVGGVLANQIYTGDTVWNRRNAARNRQKPRDSWIIVPNTHPAIIDRALFEKRKALAPERAFNLRRSPRRYVPYLLSRLVRCGHCGGTFVGRRQRKHTRAGTPYDLFRYRCTGNLLRGKDVCPTLGIHREWIEAEVVDALAREIFAPKRLAWVRDAVAQKIEAQRRLHRQDRSVVDRRLGAIERAVENYYAAIGTGLDAVVCRAHIAELETERKQLEEEAARLQQDDYWEQAQAANLEQIDRFATAFASGFRDLPFGEQRKLVLAFVDGATVVDREFVRLALKVPTENHGPASPPRRGASKILAGAAQGAKFVAHLSVVGLVYRRPRRHHRRGLRVIGWQDAWLRQGSRRRHDLHSSNRDQGSARRPYLAWPEGASFGL